MNPPGDKPRITPALLAALALAAILRMAHWAALRDSPFLDHPVIDAREYYEWAVRVKDGRGMWTEVQPHGPLYAWILGGLLALSDGGKGLAYAAQILAGLGVVFLIRRLAEQTGLRPRVVEGVGFAAALYWPLVHYDLQLLPVTWTLLLTAGSLVLLRPGGESPPKPAALWGGGMCAGLAVLGHPLLLPAFAAVWGVEFLMALRRPEVAPGSASGQVEPLPKRPWGTAVGRLGRVAGAAALPIFIVTAYNHALCGDWVLVQKNAGLNFYIGNRPDADGLPSLQPGRQYAAVRDLPLREKITGPAEQNGFFFRRSLDWIGSDPAAYAAILIRKTGVFLHQTEVPTEHDIDYFVDHSPVLKWNPVGFGLLAPFAILGMLSAWRRRGQALNLAVYSTVYAAAVIAYSVCARYRLPVVLAALPLAGLGIQSLLEARAGRKNRSVAFGAITLCAVGVLAFGPWWGLEAARKIVRTELLLAQFSLEDGKVEDGQKYFEAAVARGPSDPEVAYEHSLSLKGLKRHPEMLVEAERAVRLQPDYALAWIQNGVSLSLANRPQEAIAAFERARSLAAWDVRIGGPAWLNQGITLAQLGRLPEAVSALHEALAQQPDSVRILRELGTVYARMRRYDRGAMYLSRAVRTGLPPGEQEEDKGWEGEVWCNYGVCLFGLRQWGPAREAAMKSHALGCARAADLLRAIERAAAGGGD